MLLEKFNWTEESEKLWDKRANYWNSKSLEMWEAGSRKDIIPFLQKYLSRSAHVCDLGCGDGYGSYKLALAGYTVIGIDVSEDMIHKASEWNSGLPTRFFKGDISEVPFDDNQFDAVLAINSLEWTESPLKVLLEMKRIVKHEGKALVGILGPTAGPRENSFRRLYQEEVVCNTMMPWEFGQLAEECGWKKMDEYWVYKRDSEQLPKGALSVEMKEAISFMTVFLLENLKE